MAQYITPDSSFNLIDEILNLGKDYENPFNNCIHPSKWQSLNIILPDFNTILLHFVIIYIWMDRIKYIILQSNYQYEGIDLMKSYIYHYLKSVNISKCMGSSQKTISNFEIEKLVYIIFKFYKSVPQNTIIQYLIEHNINPCTVKFD